ncbi:50S ribosomal protein L6, partial [Mycolicibacterium thermoresistibile]
PVVAGRGHQLQLHHPQHPHRRRRHHRPAVRAGLGDHPEPVPGGVDLGGSGQRSRHPGGRHVLRRRGRPRGRGRGVQRPRHRHRCGRRGAAAAVRPADRLHRRQRHHLRRTLEHEL